MEEIRDNALQEVLTNLPQLEHPVISCVEMCTFQSEEMNQQVINKAKQIMNKKFGAECGDTVDALRTREMAKTTEKNSKNASGKEKHFNTAEFINILTDVVVDGFDLYDNEEKAMIALES